MIKFQLDFTVASVDQKGKTWNILLFRKLFLWKKNRREMGNLLSNKANILKPNSLQLQFFCEFVNVLFNSNHPSNFVSLNISHKAIFLNTKVKKLVKEADFVSTSEYWYLRWWDANKNSYAFPYRETNRQKYILRKHNGTWKVYENLRPQPRTSIPNRRRYI